MIESLQKTIEAEGNQLRRIKNDIRENEVRQMEQRTEASMQRRVAGEVETEVEKVMQVEERDRLEADYYELVQRGLEEEKFVLLVGKQESPVLFFLCEHCYGPPVRFANLQAPVETGV